MRLPALVLLATTALTGRAAVPLPDVPTVADLQAFRLTCQGQAATIALLESTGQKDKAVALRTKLWESYDAEVFARRSRLADLSLAALNPFLPAAERTAAGAAVPDAVAELAELATFSAPDAAGRARHLEQAGRTPSDVQRTRAETHATLQKIREELALGHLSHPDAARQRRDLVAQLTRAAAGKQPLAELLATARALPSSAEAFQNLTRKFAEPDLIEALFQRTGESLALEATLTALIEAAPANEVFWLARARARLQLGWRSGAAIDATIAGNLSPAVPGLDVVGKALKETPLSVAAICQEWVEPDDASEVMRQHRLAEMAGRPVVELPAELERSARAAIRNRARRLYASSFVNKPEQRQRALAVIGTDNPIPPGLFPFVAPELGQQFEAELAAAATDADQHVRVLQRYAALFGVTEGFWYRQVSLLLASGQARAVLAATDIAGALFPQAAWIQEARNRADPVPALPEAEKK